MRHQLALRTTPLCLLLLIPGCSGIVEYSYFEVAQPAETEDIDLRISTRAATISLTQHKVSLSDLTLFWTGSKDWGGEYFFDVDIETAAGADLTIHACDIVGDRPAQPKHSPHLRRERDGYSPMPDRHTLQLPVVFAAGTTEKINAVAALEFFIKQGRIRIELESDGVRRTVEIGFKN